MLCTPIISRASPLDLLEHEHALLAMPLVRSCFEHSLTAHWIAQSTPDAALAVFDHELKQRRALAKTLTAATIPEFNQAATKIGNLDDPAVSSMSEQQATKFWALLEDFEDGGANLYTHYRVLCAFTHPRMTVADTYLHADANPGSAGYGVDLQPQPWDMLPWVHLVSSCVLWAGSAIRYLQKDPKVRRQELRDASKTLGTRADIQLTVTTRNRQPTHGQFKRTH